jgi:hypothetical protein
MKNLLPLIAALALSMAAATGASAAPPTPEQEAEFYKTCVKISENETLCKCKVEAARKLIDSDFMAVVIASMEGKSLADKYYDAYNEYIGRSNEICKPEY